MGDATEIPERRVHASPGRSGKALACGADTKRGRELEELFAGAKEVSRLPAEFMNAGELLMPWGRP
jgi:hypothetical protein